MRIRANAHARSEALEWALNSGYIPNVQQSFDSFPSQLRPVADRDSGLRDVAVGGSVVAGAVGDADHPDDDGEDLDPLDPTPPPSARGGSGATGASTARRSSTVAVSSGSASGSAPFLHDAGGAVEWRTDLCATEAFWQGWYEGLSKAFLGARPTGRNALLRWSVCVVNPTVEESLRRTGLLLMWPFAVTVDDFTACLPFY
jgi:hypothetical protein